MYVTKCHAVGCGPKYQTKDLRVQLINLYDIDQLLLDGVVCYLYKT